MKQIRISDVTMKQTGQGFSLSFREKIELCKLLDKLGVDLIELEPITQPKIDSLRIKSVAAAVKNSILAVPVASICQTLFVFAMDQSKNKQKAEALALAGGGVVADMDGSEASHEESGDVALVAAASGSETTTASADLPKPSTEPETRQDMEQTQKEA